MGENKAWQKGHGEVISEFLVYLNQRTNDYILKGGTALMACYNLDRFSEDIGLDGRGGSIGNYVVDFCEQEGYSYRVAKDTDTVKRYMINYGNVGKPLKVEISFRKRDIAPGEYTRINGITVYTVGSLCVMKANAYMGRDKIRDLYDLSFICNKYWDMLPDTIKLIARNAIEYKGIEQFDYIVREQQDNLIDKNKLAEDFLNMYDRLGLLYDESEKKIMEKNFQQKAFGDDFEMPGYEPDGKANASMGPETAPRKSDAARGGEMACHIGLEP